MSGENTRIIRVGTIVQYLWWFQKLKCAIAASSNFFVLICRVPLFVLTKKSVLLRLKRNCFSDLTTKNDRTTTAMKEKALLKFIVCKSAGSEVNYAQIGCILFPGDVFYCNLKGLDGAVRALFFWLFERFAPLEEALLRIPTLINHKGILVLWFRTYELVQTNRKVYFTVIERITSWLWQFIHSSLSDICLIQRVSTEF